MTKDRAPADTPDDLAAGGPSQAIGRRSLLAGAAAAAATVGLATSAHATTVREPRRFTAGRPILISGATVVSMDQALGVRSDTDVLVVDGKIAAVGRHLSAPSHATVIRAAGALLIPGFVDTHRHMWQTSLRGVGTEFTLTNYIGFVGQVYPHFRPEDVYAANYLGMIEAVADGVTTVVDWSHASKSPAHADAAVDAHFDVPGRSRWAYGRLDSDPAWVTSGDVDRIRKERFSSSDQLVTMQLALDARPDQPSMLAAYKYAGDNDLAVSQHVGIFGWSEDAPVKWLADNSFLRPSSTLVHAATLSDDSYRRIADSGAHLSLSAESELNAGQGYPPTGKARQFGIPISLSMDTVAWWSGDMFSAMRATLSAERALAFQLAHARGKDVINNDLRTADVLRYATLGGAQALGMGDSIGSITPGKQADLVLLRNDTPSMTPVNNPIGHLVFQAGRGDVDTVIVNGKVLKHRGALVGLNLPRARRLAEQSRDHIRSAVGESAWATFLNPPPA